MCNKPSEKIDKLIETIEQKEILELREKYLKDEITKDIIKNVSEPGTVPGAIELEHKNYKIKIVMKEKIEWHIGMLRTSLKENFAYFVRMEKDGTLVVKPDRTEEMLDMYPNVMQEAGILKRLEPELSISRIPEPTKEK